MHVTLTAAAMRRCPAAVLVGAGWCSGRSASCAVLLKAACGRRALLFQWRCLPDRLCQLRRTGQRGPSVTSAAQRLRAIMHVSHDARCTSYAQSRRILSACLQIAS